MLHFSFLLPLIHLERSDTKPNVRANQARPREVQAKKQPGAALPASSKPAGGTAAPAKHKDGASGAKKTAKTTAKTGSSTQAKANPPRSTNTAGRGTGKFRYLGMTLGGLLMFLPPPPPLHGKCSYWWKGSRTCCDLHLLTF